VDSARAPSRSWGALSALTVALVALLALEALGVFHGVDLALRPGAPSGALWARLLSATASAPLAGAVIVAPLVLRALRVRVEPWLWALSASLLLATLLAEALKLVFHVPRPFSGAGGGLLGVIEEYSFPSGHASRAGAVAYQARRGGRLAAVVAWIWAVGVAASRVVLGAHWVSDVVAGLILGAWSSALVEALYPGGALR